jgi:hypothetical protein
VQKPRDGLPTIKFLARLLGGYLQQSPAQTTHVHSGENWRGPDYLLRMAGKTFLLSCNTLKSQDLFSNLVHNISSWLAAGERRLDKPKDQPESRIRDFQQ